MQTSLVSCMKDEGPFILEWVAHHLAIGFDKITITSNDTTDFGDELLTELDREGLISHIPIEVPEGKFAQQQAYHLFMDQPEYFSDDEWIIVIDADEFLNIHLGEGLVSDFLESVGQDNDLVAVNWASFGDSGQYFWEPGFVTEQYFRRIPSHSQYSAEIKTFARGISRFNRLSNHHPQKLLTDETIKIRFANGEVIEYDKSLGAMQKFIREIKPKYGSYEEAQINHYIIKSYDSFYLKRERGRGWGAQLRHNDEMFEEISLAAKEFDDSISHTSQIRRQKYDDLMSISQIRDIQFKIIEAYKAKMRRVHEQADLKPIF